MASLKKELEAVALRLGSRGGRSKVGDAGAITYEFKKGIDSWAELGRFTAPSDGVFICRYWTKSADFASVMIQINGMNVFENIRIGGSRTSLDGLPFPVCKGDSVAAYGQNVFYDAATDNPGNFVFIPTVGSTS